MTHLTGLVNHDRPLQHSRYFGSFRSRRYGSLLEVISYWSLKARPLLRATLSSLQKQSEVLLPRYNLSTGQGATLGAQASTMTCVLPTERRAFRRTDNYQPGAPKLKLVTEPIPSLQPTFVLIKVYAVSLNYRDANIANGGNPWPVIPNGILCNDAAGEVIAVGDKVQNFKVGDRVAPVIDTQYVTGRETGRSWLAADEDGVLADHISFDERVLCKLPTYLDWVSAATIPCAGVTAWAALRGLTIGQTVLIQGKVSYLAGRVPAVSNNSKTA